MVRIATRSGPLTGNQGEGADGDPVVEITQPTTGNVVSLTNDQFADGNRSSSC
jgi:hypothetical protein